MSVATSPPALPKVVEGTKSKNMNALATRVSDILLEPRQRRTLYAHLANVAPATITYHSTHLLGLPQEVRDKIYGQVDSVVAHRPQESLGAHPVTHSETLQLVSRQIFHEVSSGWIPSTRIVHHHQVEAFIHLALGTPHVLQTLKSLTIEIPHDVPTKFFPRLSGIFQSSTSLEELKIFGVGRDLLGMQTSSVAHPCGKHDTSLMTQPSRQLTIDGQDFARRLVLVKSLQFLSKLRVLVLDNLNFPLLQAHVLRNKPHLEHLRIGTDPRSVTHLEYRTRQDTYGLGNLVFPVREPPAPVKRLEVTSNGTITTFGALGKVAATLEELSLVIPNVLCNNNGLRFDFLVEGAHILRKVGGEAKKLRTLRICIHGAIYETSHHFATFMGAFKDSLRSFKVLKTVELHINSESPWLAQEFIEALPRSVERLYISDNFAKRSVRDITTILNDHARLFLLRGVQEAVGMGVVEDELKRKDFIPFCNDLGFVGFEFEVLEGSRSQARGIDEFLAINGRMLDKERNKHLARHQGRHIPYPESAIFDEDTTALHYPPALEANTSSKEIDECGLQDDRRYFGFEDVAEVVFHNEPVAKVSDRMQYGYPVVVEVGDTFKDSNHWLSS